jgi:aminoglycoside 3-N-acetyltransferase I
MSYTFKQLFQSDVTEIRDLLFVFGKAFREERIYQDNIPDDEYLVNLLGEKHFIVLVAKDRTKVVGGLVAYVLQKFEQKRSEIYIYDLAVAKEHRRKGIAKTLIAKLGNIGKTLGAYVIFVQADQEDEPAIKLYESVGKKENDHHFDIAVN